MRETMRRILENETPYKAVYLINKLQQKVN